MDLERRMKQYEAVSSLVLPRRMPFIIRIDGKAFHTFTKGMAKPWDNGLISSLLTTAMMLCRNIQVAKLAYWQSDEISILATDYDSLKTDSWLGKKVQKIVSVSASIATACFNCVIREEYPDHPLAFFDARVFVLPRDEVCNYFVWRQQDAVRNSIQSLAQAHFSHKELHGLSCNLLQDKLMTEKNINWNSLCSLYKRGACIVRTPRDDDSKLGWCLDYNIPIFTGERDYIEKHVFLEELQQSKKAQLLN